MMHILLFHWIMLHICIVGTLSQNTVRGVVGQAVTLPCTYHVRSQSDLTNMCWGRGSCPNSKCRNEILRTNGRRVTSKKSYRYHLNGYVTRGDVSLTIENLNEGDRGVYCCRVEIRGWFNDIKKNLNLQVERATTTVSTTTITTTSQTSTTTLTTTSVTTIPPVSPTFLLTTKPAFPATSTATSALTLPTSSMPTAIAVSTQAPSSLLTTESASSMIPTAGDSLTLPTSSVPTIPVGTTIPSFFLTSKPVSTMTPSATSGLTLSTSSMSTAISVAATTPSFFLTTKPTFTAIPSVTPSATDGLTLPTAPGPTAIAFLVPTTPLVNTKSSPISSQKELIKSDYVTTETATEALEKQLQSSKEGASMEGEPSTSVDPTGLGTSDNHSAQLGQTILEFFKKFPQYYSVLIACALVICVLPLILVLRQMKCKKMRKYELDKMKSLNKQEEPEQTPTGTEGENGLFPL